MRKKKKRNYIKQLSKIEKLLSKIEKNNYLTLRERI